MADYNTTDRTEDRQRKQAHSGNGIRSPSLMGSKKCQGEIGIENLPKKKKKTEKGNRKSGRSASTKKVIKS